MSRDGVAVGAVTSGNFSPVLGHGIALGFVDPKIVSGDDLILEWPLATGQKYACDAYSMARSDNMYCWIVSSLARTSLQGVSGIPAGERDEYVLEFRTNPDDTEFSFVPEIGITKYAYHHHGTVADTELQLLEFHPGSVKGD